MMATQPQIDAYEYSRVDSIILMIILMTLSMSVYLINHFIYTFLMEDM
jgi:hypothetical protein